MSTPECLLFVYRLQICVIASLPTVLLELPVLMQACDSKSACEHRVYAHVIFVQGQAGQNQQGGGCAGRFVKTAFYAVASGFGFTLGSDAANDVVHGIEGH